MNKFIPALLAALLAAGIFSVPAEGATAHKKAVTKSEKSKKAEPEPDISGATPTEYTCEKGEKITLYRTPGNEQEAVMRWNKHLHKMTRVDTDTGAERYESKNEGLTWIGVPVKAMLLDAKKGHTLANDCKKPGQ